LLHFTASHRGGSGPPLILLHGFLDTWRTWELLLPSLERSHEVLAPALAGHAGGPAIDGVGHCPQLDVPLETAQLVLGVTAS
jgi:hypothetical protein